MSRRPKYPLLSALRVRETAVERAQDHVLERERELAVEEEKLRRLEIRRDVLYTERDEASERLYDTEGAQTLEVSEIDRRRGAHDFLARRITGAEAEIAQQEIEAAAAQARLDGARAELSRCVRDLEVLKKHHTDWRAKQRRLERRQEEKQLQEVVTNRYGTRKTSSTDQVSRRIK